MTATTTKVKTTGVPAINTQINPDKQELDDRTNKKNISFLICL